MNNKYLITAVTLLALPMGSALADAKFDKMMKDSFQANGIATLDRLNQDDIVEVEGTFFAPVKK